MVKYDSSSHYFFNLLKHEIPFFLESFRKISGCATHWDMLRDAWNQLNFLDVQKKAYLKYFSGF